MVGSMMERTQIYLTREQREALKTIAKRSGQSLSEIIREAIDAYIVWHREMDRRELMHRAVGMWTDRDDLPEFFEELRREGNRDLIDEPVEPLPAGY
jgi:predicted DNA-binding protein